MTTRHAELQIAANKFHDAHPIVWVLFSKYTFQLIARGFKHYSADAIFHRIRWETDKPDYVKGESFKLNDHYPAFYSRAFMKLHPQYKGFFRTRVQTSKNAPATHRPAPEPWHFDNLHGTINV